MCLANCLAYGAMRGRSHATISMPRRLRTAISTRNRNAERRSSLGISQPLDGDQMESLTLVVGKLDECLPDLAKAYVMVLDWRKLPFGLRWRNFIVIDRNDDDGNGTACADDGLQCDFGPEGNNQIGVQPHQVRRGDKRAAWVIQVSIINGYIVLVEAKLPQPRHERFIWDDRRRAREGRAEKTESHNFAGLLRARRERPRSRTTKQRYEFASSHSITSSARSWNSRLMTSPSACAVLRLNQTTKSLHHRDGIWQVLKSSLAH
jgi:hypothetical protein